MKAKHTAQLAALTKELQTVYGRCYATAIEGAGIDSSKDMRRMSLHNPMERDQGKGGDCCLWSLGTVISDIVQARCDVYLGTSCSIEALRKQQFRRKDGMPAVSHGIELDHLVNEVNARMQSGSLVFQSE